MGKIKKDDKCCGSCCWFCHENADGWGNCVNSFPVDNLMHCSDLCTTDEYVSRQEMRHHMAVLLQYKRYAHDIGVNYRWPPYVDRLRAMEFAYNYMKVFSKL